MDGDGPYGRYYAERAAAGKRTVLWPWLLLGAVLPLLLVRSLVVDGAPADASARLQSAAAVPVTLESVSDGEYPVGPELTPGRYVTDGPPRAGGTCSWVRTGPDGREIARAVVRAAAAVGPAAGETVRFAGGCSWSLG